MQMLVSKVAAGKILIFTRVQYIYYFLFYCIFLENLFLNILTIRNYYL